MNFIEIIGNTLIEILKWFGMVINFLTDWGLIGPSEWVIIGTAIGIAILITKFKNR